MLAACALGLLAHVAWAANPAGFQEQNIPRPDGAAQWNGIVGVRFLANGRGFAWERDGRVWIVDPANPSPTPFLDISAEVGAWRDHGMLGFALHPNFVNNGYVYVLYVVDTHHLTHCDSSNPGPAVCDSGYNPTTNEYLRATMGRLTRYQAVKPAGDKDYARATTVDYSTRTVLVGNTPRIGMNNATYPYPPLPANQIHRAGCPILYESHGVGSLVFGEDGTLLASCGDGASYNIMDPGSISHTYYQDALNLGLIRTKENVGAFRAQLVDTLSGKIWRLDPATGAGVPSNPFYDASAPYAPRSRVWALGLRNPFRFTLREGTGSHNAADARPGTLYIGDVGWSTWEDLHVDNAPALNFGWPLFEGMEVQTSYWNSTAANRDAPNPLFGIGGCTQQFFRFRDLIQQDTLASPLSFPNPCNTFQEVPITIPVFLHSRPAIDWHHSADRARWAAFNGDTAEQPLIGQSDTQGTWIVAGAPFRGNTSNAGTWYTGDQFPPEYKNTYFHTDYGAQWIRNFVFNENDFPVEVRQFNPSAGGVVNMAQHPDGTLYYIAWATFLRKVSYVGTGNRPPTAVVAAVTPPYGPSPLNVQFSAAGSSDPDGQALTYEWNWGDGSPLGSGQSAQHTFTATSGAPARFTVTLTVRDPLGASGQATIIVSPNNTPPQATILTPVDGSTYSMSGNTILNLQAQLADAETGAGSLTCEWLNVLHHNEHTHEDSIIEGCSATSPISPIGCGDESYHFSIRLKVTDPQGLTTERESHVYPRCDGNPPPVAGDDSATVALGGIVNLPVIGNDTDDTGLDASSVQIVAPPAHGTASVLPGGVISYSNTQSLLPDELYYVVRDLQGSISNAARVTFINQASTDVTPPSIPQDLVAVAVGPNQIDLSWSTSSDTGGSGLAAYRIYRNGSTTPLATVNGTTHSDTGLTASTSYSYRVTAVDGAGNESPLSAVASATTHAPPADTTPPTVPQNLTATALGTQRIDLSWAASTDTGGSGLVGYRIYRDGSTAALATVAGTTFPDTTVLANTTYSYQVTAIDGAGNESGLSNVASATTAAAPVWISQDIGAVSAAGSFTQNGSSVSIVASGEDIWGTADEFHYVFQPLNGDGELIARLTGLSNEHMWTKAGLMIRESLAPGSRHGTILVGSGKGISFQYRNGTGASSRGDNGNGNITLPRWLRVTRQGDVIRGYYSDDGVNWSQRGTVTLGGLPGAVYIGLALTSHLDGVLSTAQFDSVTIPGAVPTNQPPVASFTATPLTGVAPLTVSFDGTGSADADGTIASYLWDFGHQGSSTSATPSFTFTQPGLYVVTLTVTDDDSATDIAAPLTIEVLAEEPANQPPQVNGGPDRSGLVGATIHLDGAVTDDGKPNPPGALTVGWSVFSGPGVPTWPQGDQNNPHAHPVFSVPGTYVLRLTASDGELSASDDVTVVVSAPDTTPPSAPTNLVATAVSFNRIDLTWAAAADAGGSGIAGYRIYRDGSATPLATVTGTAFSDTTVVANTAYTYQVTAVDGASNESGLSAPAAATTLAAPAWLGQDIGAVGAAGSFTQNGSTFTINASGADIWYAADEFHYVYQPLNGDGELIARLSSLSNQHMWTKAGVMIRETLTANARHGTLFVGSGKGISFQYRSTTGANSGGDNGNGITDLPRWIRITRQGDVIRGYYSADGVNWSQRGTVTLTGLASSVYIGLALTSHVDGVIATAQIDNVQVITPEPQVLDTVPPSVPQNVQAIAVSASRIDLTWSASTDNGGSGLAGYSIFRDGGATPVATVTTTSWSDTGLSPETTYSYTVRAFDAATNTSALSGVATATTLAPPPPDTTPPTTPQHLQASASGPSRIDLSWEASTDTGSGVASYRIYRDGSTTPITSVTTLNYSDTGLSPSTTYSYAVSAVDVAGNESPLSAAASATTLNPPSISSSDIGAVGAAGSTIENAGTLTLTGSGADIWYAADEFQFAYRPLEGDGEVIARVTSLSNPHIWTKIGVMIRESLTANSRHATMYVSSGRGTSFQYRLNTGANSAGDNGNTVLTLPQWIRIVREGNVVRGYYSADGVTWTQRGSITFSTLSTTTFVGLALTSHVDGTLATATVDNFSVIESGPAEVDTTPPSVPQQLAAQGAEATMFAPHVSYAAGTNTHSVHAAHLNGDAHLDLVAADAATDTASVYLGNGDGTFGARTAFTVGDEPKSVRTADFNGDGNLDLVSADQGTGAATGLLGNGNGTFGAAVSYPACNNTKAHEVALADFNNDTRQDIVLTCHGNNYVSVLLGHGNGTFQTAVNHTVGSAPHSVVALDFNGDSKVDIAVANRNSNTVSIRLGDGSGGFAGAVNYPVGNGPHSVRAGDLNGDGRLDLVTANDLDNSVSVLLGNGNGTFTSNSSFVTGPVPKSVALVDLDADGALDVVTANTGGNYPTCCNPGGDEVSVLYGNGAGGLGTPQNFTVGTTPFSVAAADFDGDGRPDLATANWHGNSVSVLINQADGVQVSLSWQPSTDAGTGRAGYRVYRGGAQIATTAVPSYTDRNVQPRTPYSYEVSAFDNAHPPNESARSAPVNVTTPVP